MRPLGLASVAAATLMAQQVAPAWVGGHIPTHLAYTLDASCHWHPRPWVLYLGPSVRPAPDMAGRAAEARCWAAHGAAGAIPFLKVVDARFPSRDQLARWESEDANPLRPPPND